MSYNKKKSGIQANTNKAEDGIPNNSSRVVRITPNKKADITAPIPSKMKILRGFDSTFSKLNIRIESKHLNGLSIRFLAQSIHRSNQGVIFSDKLIRYERTDDTS